MNCENNQVYLFRKILVISINAMLMMMKAIFPVMVINIRNDLLNIYQRLTVLWRIFHLHLPRFKPSHQYVES